MIGNIVDNRIKQYRWARITVILEPTWHDNRCVNSDQAEKGEDEGMGYQEYPDIALSDAMVAAYALPYMVTVYLYDLGEGIKEAK